MEPQQLNKNQIPGRDRIKKIKCAENHKGEQHTRAKNQQNKTRQPCN